ncbi:MAG: DNA cytosine methyltransferase [Gammaproteobacteria bacterium]|nr:DNA cytosine methyltransferase [Gammaproteobacteria bacterium]
MSIKIIDLFAGPGGLGEGFSAFKNESGDSPFKIALSIEKEKFAHQTLTLRSFYRQFEYGKAPDEYYDFLNGKLGKSPEDALFKLEKFKTQVTNAKSEAQMLTLGEDNAEINKKIKAALGNTKEEWILIGGPPCQAYSLAGRSRNKGIKDYVPEEDHRNYLYKEYLKVISRFNPSIFVMENVKGMLSARLDGKAIFPKIMNDLKCPQQALNNNDKKTEYEIFSLVVSNDDLISKNMNPSDFIIHSELYGIPQARHRVIVLGIRRDLVSRWSPDFILKKKDHVNTEAVISDLPVLRSGFSSRPHKADDLPGKWSETLFSEGKKLLKDLNSSGLEKVAELMDKSLNEVKASSLGRGQNWNVRKKAFSKKLPEELKDWYSDPTGRTICTNHETRSHISQDLLRYLFSSCYTKINENSPKTAEFPEALFANHANWNSGHFADRFRTQAGNRFSTTITSHISKDGHYYIHYDPAQCRSLTVREAARLQTFPDNYLFVGNRTQQYVQVGNAVPPFLAFRIAKIIYKIL